MRMRSWINIFKQIHINLPFLEDMIHMPKGAKVLKNLLSHKEKLENAALLVKLSEECSAVIQKGLLLKGDPRSFTLPCLIRPLAVKNALADLGASINLMPYSLFRKLEIYELKPTKMSIQLADHSLKYLIGVCENLLVKINKFIISVNFVVLEMDEDESVPIILGRPFLATACSRVVSRGASFTQGTIPSIPIGGSISPEGFLLLVLLLVVIIVTVVVIVILIVVVVDDVSLILKLLFEIIGVPVGSVFMLGLLALAIVATCASKAVAMPLAITSRGYGMIHNDGDGDNDAYDDEKDDDEREINNVVEEEDEGWICFLGGNNSSGIKKYWGSNSGDGGNTRDGVKIAGEVIGSGDGIDENTGGIILSLKVSKELKELLPDEAGK
ncbi:reverse transcriptase domain-containing protein [Tanacetum coccineum]